MNSLERHELRYQRRKQKRLENKIRNYKNFDNFEEVFTFEHLYDGYKKSCRNVGWKASTQSYKANATLNVYQAYKNLHDGTFKSDGFYEFDISERGKTRHIRSVTIRERVVQRCLCDYSLVPLLSRTFIYDNGASMTNKGYTFAIKRIQRHLHHYYHAHGANGYVLLFDFSKYFDNILHELLFKILENIYTDERLLKLSKYFVEAFGDKGLGLGSQVSQILALAAANKLDHIIKEKLHIKYYGRYMDDGYLIHSDKKYLKYCLEEIKKICDELGIILNTKKTKIIKITHPFTFLKIRFFITPSGKVIKKVYKRSVVKMRKKLKKFKIFAEKGKMSLSDIYQSYQSWRNYISNMDSYYTRTRMDELYDSLFSCNRNMITQEVC